MDEATLATLRDKLRDAYTETCVLVVKLPEGRTRDLVLATASNLERRIRDLGDEIATLDWWGDAA